MKSAIFIAIPVLCLSGCATIFTGTTDNVTFNSVPSGAKIDINGNTVGRTPITIPMRRGFTPPQVQLKLDGYESKNIQVQNSFNTVSILDILFWPAFIVDAATGSMMKYDIVNYQTELDQKK
jgi:uncharacterized protein YceK